MKKIFMILNVCILLSIFSGCGNNTTVTANQENAPTAMNNNAGPESKPCPVCEMTLMLKDNPLSMEVKGKKLYYCSQACLDKFKADPDKYFK